MTDIKENTKMEYDTTFTRNRELSWLKFNERVLNEANDDFVPLFERLKFVSIFTSNLDEFFMIRAGSLYDLSLINEAHADNKSKMTAREQLKEIYKAAAPLYKLKDHTFFQLENQLRQHDIYKLEFSELENPEKKFIQNFYETYILPVLSPQIVDTHHPFPHIENKLLNVVMMLKAKDDVRFGIIPVPRSIPRLVFLPGSSVRYMLIEDIILENAQNMFEMYTMSEKCVISVTRNADINPDDESFGFEEDYRLHMKKILKKRSRLSAVRLETQSPQNHALIDYLCARLLIHKDQVFSCASPLDMSYAFALEENLPPSLRRALLYKPFEPQLPARIDINESIFKQVLKRDLLLCYPYESMEPFLRLVKEAASDPGVISIKVTLYRIDKKSRLTEYLINAAEMNKDVTVIMELRARFDEQNNIEWAERLEESGCRVIYGFEEFKVHSKICLITRHEKNRLQYITHIGTGNFNEKTAKLYTDFSLITANEAIGMDAVAFFKNMSISNPNGQYNHLLVAPSGLKRSVISLIEAQIQKAAEGKPSGIFLKLNSLTDRDILDKLKDASNAGVPVKLIIRGICCIAPGIPGKTENISVTSIVGRFLEHSRVYCFGEGNDMQMYISSADMMTRNTERRIEIACPILDRDIKKRIWDMLILQLSDDTKARELKPDGNYTKKIPAGDKSINSQEYFMEEAMQNAKIQESVTQGFIGKIKGLARSFYPTW